MKKVISIEKNKEVKNNVIIRLKGYKVMNISLDDIKVFRTEDNRVVMELKNGNEIRFDVLENAFHRYDFFNLINGIKVTEQYQGERHQGTETLVQMGNYHITLNEVVKKYGTERDPAEIYEELLEEEKLHDFLKAVK